MAKRAITRGIVRRWRKVTLVTLTQREVPLTIRMSLSPKTEWAPIWGNKHITECQRNFVIFSDFVWRPRSLWFIGHWCYEDVHQQGADTPGTKPLGGAACCSRYTADMVAERRRGPERRSSNARSKHREATGQLWCSHTKYYVATDPWRGLSGAFWSDAGLR